ncbi:hypothetical protein F511_04145 [Dorcoceras hygrometricum]|uniref:Uncharacterized protein n=1 Tax=Dorcoceras hygrometricum TaxID=472368 RepID=A0A2Z7BI24_9LAMI|nr:hypothetical protein F511_04145 [Dorcoceras hygrometricum]
MVNQIKRHNFSSLTYENFPRAKLSQPRAITTSGARASDRQTSGTGRWKTFLFDVYNNKSQVRERRKYVRRSPFDA